MASYSIFSGPLTSQMTSVVERVQAEFNDSIGKLEPLFEKIGVIDKLIDTLYGLTEDEIKIVEESISGTK